MEKRTRVMVGLVATVAVYTAGHVGFAGNEEFHRDWVNTAWILMCAAATFAAVRARQRTVLRHISAAWGYFAIGFAVWCLGGLLTFGHELVYGYAVMFPSVIHILFAFTAPAMLLGMFCYRNERSGWGALAKTVGEFGLFVSITGMLIGLFLFEPFVGAVEPFSHAVMALITPGVSLVTALLAALTAIQSRSSAHTRVLVAVSVTMVLHFLATVLLLRVLSGESEHLYPICEFVWAVEVAIFTWGATEAPGTHRPVRLRDFASVDVFVMGAGISGSGLLLLLASQSWTRSSVPTMGVGLLATGIFLSLRHLGLVSRQRALSQRLSALNASLEVRVIERTRSLQLARDEAIRANREKSRFLANMSHELRTPLSGILGYAELLAEEVRDATPEELGGDINAIRQAGGQLLRLIDELLDLSRAEADSAKPIYTMVRVEELAATLQATVAPLIAANGNRFLVDISGAPETVETDHGRVLQIVLNLLSNAAKFTHDGTITLRFTTDGDALVVSVADTGTGIGEQDLARVFEPFEQAGQSQATRRAGTGLGLAISRSFAKLLGGSLTATSVLGEGSVFVLRLPVKAARRAPVAESSLR